MTFADDPVRVVKLAAEFLRTRSAEEIAALWSISPEFEEKRQRVLDGPHKKPPESYLEMVHAFAHLGTERSDEHMFDSALLALCIADLVGVDGLPTVRIQEMLQVALDRPVAKPDAAASFRALWDWP